MAESLNIDPDKVEDAIKIFKSFLKDKDVKYSYVEMKYPFFRRLILKAMGITPEKVAAFGIPSFKVRVVIYRTAVRRFFKSYKKGIIDIEKTKDRRFKGFMQAFYRRLRKEGLSFTEQQSL